MWWTVAIAVMNLQVPCNAGNVACFLPGWAKDLSTPLYFVCWTSGNFTFAVCI